MELQNFQVKNEEIKKKFLDIKRNNSDALKNHLNLSWSNWGFGIEQLEVSAKRLKKCGIKFIELHGNHYTSELGYGIRETKKILNDNGLSVSGVCGMFSQDNDLSSNRAIQRQMAIDYIKREIHFTSEMEGYYLLIVPGAVGRPDPYDDTEFERSVESLRLCADLFVSLRVKAAVEPIRSAEVSFIHTVEDAIKYIEAVNHPGVKHINGDVYHMLSEESHVGNAVLTAEKFLTNLHIADTNRCALGEGSLDLDTLIMALYIIGYNREGCFVTPEPLGPGGDPYPAMYGRPNTKELDNLVSQTVNYFRQREDIVRSL